MVTIGAIITLACAWMTYVTAYDARMRAGRDPWKYTPAVLYFLSTIGMVVATISHMSDIAGCQ